MDPTKKPFQPVVPIITSEVAPAASDWPQVAMKSYSQLMNEKVPFFLRVVATFWHFLYLLIYIPAMNALISAGYASNSGYSSAATNPLRYVLYFVPMLLGVLTIYVVVRQYLFITKVMRRRSYEPILITHAVMSIIIFLGIVVGSIIAYLQFGTSVVKYWQYPFFVIGIVLATLMSPTMSISQFVYIQTGGISHKIALTGKILRVIGFIAVTIIALVIGWFIVVLSDPSTE
jgi:hypothetical protein